jgi:hypothetical protein
MAQLDETKWWSARTPIVAFLENGIVRWATEGVTDLDGIVREYLSLSTHPYPGLPTTVSSVAPQREVRAVF